MDWLDIILGILLLLNFFSGFKHGFFKEVGGLIGLIAGVFAAIALHQKTALLLTNIFSIQAPWVVILGFMIPFIGVMLFFAILAMVFNKLFLALSLGWLNRLAGSLFSVVKSVIILSLLFNLYEYADKDKSVLGSYRIEHSQLYKGIRDVVPNLYPSFSNKLDQTKDKVQNNRKKIV
jgi:membrane protein required for colicin V production